MEFRGQDTESHVTISAINAIVTDIEGTTTSVDFVYQVLFPYARRRIAAFVRKHADSMAVREQLNEVMRIECRPLSPDEAGAVLMRWIDEDRKATPLKALEGMIWAQGYADGALKGHVYPDVPQYLRLWSENGKRVYVYSSGSVEAQRLIFGYSEYGDLTPLISGYFDTTIGNKREVAPYRLIVDRLGERGRNVLFLSDLGEELDAARSAGLCTCQLLRDARTQRAESHCAARDFAEVESFLQTAD